jgi:hypothetical protein
MPLKSTAVAEDDTFCIAVQRCSYAGCTKNGTHHLSINTTASSDTGQDRSEALHRWYCDRHFNKVVGN